MTQVLLSEHHTGLWRWHRPSDCSVGVLHLGVGSPPPSRATWWHGGWVDVKDEFSFIIGRLPPGRQGSIEAILLAREWRRACLQDCLWANELSAAAASRAVQMGKRGEHFMVNTQFRGKQNYRAIQRLSVPQTELRSISLQHSLKFFEPFGFWFGCLSSTTKYSLLRRRSWISPHSEVPLCGSEGFPSSNCRLRVLLLKSNC